MDKNQLQVLARTLVSKYAMTQLSNGYQPERIHVYDDAQGNMLYFRIRLKHPKTGDKWIRPFHLDTTKQEYIMKEPHFKDGKPLYHLSAIAKSSTEDIWLFEGEKCVDIAEKLNLLVTTSGGATSSHDADWGPLKNRNIIIWPDNDKEGLEYSKEVAHRLLALNCHVRQVDIEHLNLPEKGDIFDWLSANPHADIQQVPLIDVLVIESSNILYSKASDIKPAPINWLWREHFARGKYSMIVGDPGLGKSQLTAYIASIVTQAGIWPDKTACEQSGEVIILSAEDDPACTIVPRLIAAGANLNKVNIIEAVKAGCDYRGNPVLKQFDFITDIEELDKMLANNTNVTTVIIDPLSAYLGNTNSHNNSDVRTVLTPIAKLAEKYNIAMICVSHLNKAGNGNAMSRVSGSIAFIAASRAAFIVVKDKEDAEKRLFIQIKNNLGNCKEGLMFHIEPASLENNINTSRVKWLDETTTISADEALNTFPTVDDDKNSLAEAKDFLFDLLSQNSLTQQQIKKEAKDFGCAWRTVERAKKSLGIKSRKNGDKWEWYFPTQDCQESQTSFTEY